MTPEELKQKILNGTIVKQADGTFRLVEKNSNENFKDEEEPGDAEKIKAIYTKAMATAQEGIDEGLDLIQGIKRR